MSNLRRFKKPCTRVLVSKSGIYKTEVSKTSEFNSVLTESEQRVIASNKVNKHVFNGSVIRLNGLTRYGVASVSIVGFYDFIMTNMALQYDLKYLLDNDARKIAKFRQKIRRNVWLKRKRSFDSVMQIKELANIIAVSVTVTDVTGRTLIVKRQSEGVVSSGLYATACTGSVLIDDLKYDDPYQACAIRELKEELNLECELKTEMVVISKQKLQPVVLISGRVNCHFEELYEAMKLARDFKEENCELYAVPSVSLVGVVKYNDFTDVAAYQLAGESKHWHLALPVDIEKYKLRDMYLF